jgi:hypothetical protein
MAGETPTWITSAAHAPGLAGLRVRISRSRRNRRRMLSRVAKGTGLKPADLLSHGPGRLVMDVPAHPPHQITPDRRYDSIRSDPAREWWGAGGTRPPGHFG